MRGFASLVLGSVMTCVLLASPSFAQYGDGTGSGPPPLEEWDAGIAVGAPLSSWHGTQQSLPYGPGLSSSYVVSAALAMAQVQKAIDALAALGYVRRADLDVGYSQEGSATAVVSFQFPGVDPRDRQPYILIVTREDSYRVFTQVMATATATGPDDTPAHDELAPTACNFFVDRATEDGERVILASESGPLNPVVWSTAYDIKNGTAFPSAQTQHFMSVASECWRNNMRTLARNMATGAAWAAIGGARGGPQGAAWGAAVGAGAAAHAWFYDGASPCP